MWCVAELNDEDITRMEDVLETYEKPYDPAEPVVCLDEKPVTLHADVRPASAAKRGREARRDNGYERRGTANVLCAVEPKAGRHFTFPAPNCSAFELGGRRTGHAVPRGQNHPFGNRQPQHPPPEVFNRCLRNPGGHRDLGALYDSLHPKTRQLAQPGGNRNWPIRPAMPRESENPGPQGAPP